MHFFNTFERLACLKKNPYYFDVYKGYSNYLNLNLDTNSSLFYWYFLFKYFDE